jgi:hypothetical protein
MSRTKQELRTLKLKSHAIRNLTFDAALASRAKHWGADRLMKELGIDWNDPSVRRKAQKLKPIPKDPQKLTRVTLPYRKFLYAKGKGVQSREALEYLRKPFKQIDEYIEFTRPKRGSHVIHKRAPWKKTRRENWSAFSSRDGELPDAIESRAIRLNRSNGLDDSDHYGYIVMYYAYIENESIAKWANIIHPDKFGVDYYKDMVNTFRPQT